LLILTELVGFYTLILGCFFVVVFLHTVLGQTTW